jgi:glucokinase
MAKLMSLGIDIGGTKTRLALFDEKFRVVKSIRHETPNDKKQFTQLLTESVGALSEQAAPGIVTAIGVGFAGSVNSHKGIVMAAPNLPALKGYCFPETLKRLSRGTVTLYNDVHAALYGELKLGAAIGCKHVIGVWVGTGIGGAIIADGKLHLGACGEGGNIGHFLLQPFGALTDFERKSTLDDVSSRLAIAGSAATLAAKHWAPYLMKVSGTDVRQIKSTALAAAIRGGDTAVEELVRSRARMLGIVLANVVAFFDPEMIVLGGGLTDAMPSVIRQEVAAGIKAHPTQNGQRNLRVVTSKLRADAVTAGAARLAIDHYLAQKGHGRKAA